MNSGVASVSWRAGDSGAFTTVAGDTVSIPIATRLAKQTFEYYSTDAVGNTSATASFAVTAIPAAPRVLALNAAHVVRGGTVRLRYSMSDTAVAKLSCRLFVTRYGKSRLAVALGDQPVGTTLAAAARVTLPVGYAHVARARPRGRRAHGLEQRPHAARLPAQPGRVAEMRGRGGQGRPARAGATAARPLRPCAWLPPGPPRSSCAWPPSGSPRVVVRAAVAHGRRNGTIVSRAADGANNAPGTVATGDLRLE